jgi:vesicle transport through interaction with t-SNAREs protein 1
LCFLLDIAEEKKHKLSELKTGLDEAESLIRRMDLEARSLPPTQKATLLAKLQEYKSDLNNLKREFKKVSSAQDPVASRNELMESGMADHVMVCNKTLELPAFLLRHY